MRTRSTRFAWLLSLAVWLALVQYGMSTARLGENESSYGVLDDSVRSFLVARLPLTGVSVSEWVAAVTDPAHTKYGCVHRRQTYRKSRGGSPSLWLQTALITFLRIRTLLTATVLHIRTLITATVLRIRIMFALTILNIRINFQITTLCVRVVLGLLHARTPLPVTSMCVRILLTVLCAPARRQVRRVYHVHHQCRQAVVVVLSGYSASVIQMLLMLSGNVERNPGPVVTLKDLISELKEVVDWFELGLHLPGVEQADLEIIKYTHRLSQDLQDCKTDLFILWLRNCPESTWSTVVRALRDIRMEPLARKLAKKYGVSMPLHSESATSAEQPFRGMELEPRKEQEEGDEEEEEGKEEEQKRSRNRKSKRQEHVEDKPAAVKRAKLISSQPSVPVSAAAAVHSFKRCRRDLLSAITDPLQLANTLYSEDIISSETCEHILSVNATPTEKIMHLLHAIEVRLATHPSDLTTLVTILDDELGQRHLARKLRKMCCESSCSALPVTHLLEPMDRFGHFLKAVYKKKNMSLASAHKEYPIPTTIYTNLAVVKKEVDRAKADRFTIATLHGGLDEIMNEKEPIFLEDVFKPEEGQQAVTCVLAEGAPGVGKSMFALELCRRWDSIKLMKKFVAVVLLRLREKRVQEARCVADLFYHDDPDIQQAVGKQVSSSSGENVLLVLDGFDELPVHLLNSLFLAEVIRGECLPYATILVTSRPSARANFLSLCPKPDKHIEVLGFTSELVDQYANSVYGGDTPLLADFRLYANANPAIKSMMYIPLNSAIVVEIYRENREVGRPLPQTETQLYAELTLIRIRSYLREQHNQSIESLPVKLEDLPQEVRDQLCSLAKLAFEGIMDKEVIFRSLPAGCTTLGLMTASQELYIGKRGAVNYNFFHLTYQEFLAAFHISQLPCSDQNALFLQCLDEEHPPNMSVVWRFVAGMTGFQDIGWDTYLRLINGEKEEEVVVIEKGEKVEEGEEEEEGKDEEEGVKQKEDHRQIVTPFLSKCLYEAQEKVDSAMILGRSRIKFTGNYYSSSFECFVVGYCVAACRCEWGVHLLYNGLGAEMVEMLGCGLRSREGVCGSIWELDLTDNPIGQEGVAHLKELPRKVLQGISRLCVRHCKLDRSALDCLSCLIPIITSLKELVIGYNPAGDGGTMNLLKVLAGMNQLHRLEMDSMAIGFDDVMALSLLIQRSAGSLKELWIGDDGMLQEQVDLMVEKVLSPSSLENLKIVYTDLTSCSSAPLLDENHNLLELELYQCTLDNEVVSFIAKALHRNTTLRELRLVHCSSRSPVDGVALSGMLRNNQSLTRMTIELGDIDREAVRALAAALQDNQTLERLTLSLEYRGFYSDIELEEMDPRVKFMKFYSHPY